jgi:glycosyltransferase involved in cell wall biosynthesis
MTDTQYFCTTIIPTVARTTLDKTVASVLNQQFDQPFEIIVVNDSGRPLPPAAWQQAAGVQVVNTFHRERSMARNTGAALARGRYLHFLDDDDWMLPGALAVFWKLAQNSPAAWLYGASQLTNSQGVCLFQFNSQIGGNVMTQVMAGEWVPVQASLILAEAFFEVGGYDNTMPGAQDKDLMMRIALRYEIAGTPTPVAGILRGVWATVTDYSTIPIKWRRSSDRVLSQSGIFRRLWASAHNAYWHGRWLRVYLLSALYNARVGRLFTCCSRLAAAAAVMLLAGPRLLSPDFWKALTRTHLTAGFEPGQAATLKK